MILPFPCPQTTYLGVCARSTSLSHRCLRVPAISGCRARPTRCRLTRPWCCIPVFSYTHDHTAVKCGSHNCGEGRRCYIHPIVSRTRPGGRQKEGLEDHFVIWAAFHSIKQAIDPNLPNIRTGAQSYTPISPSPRKRSTCEFRPRHAALRGAANNVLLYPYTFILEATHLRRCDLTCSTPALPHSQNRRGFIQRTLTSTLRAIPSPGGNPRTIQRRWDEPRTFRSPGRAFYHKRPIRILLLKNHLQDKGLSHFRKRRESWAHLEI